jgi:hypothetical protein
MLAKNATQGEAAVEYKASQTKVMSIRDDFTEVEWEGLIASAMRNLNLSRRDAERLLNSRDRPVKRNPVLERQWVRNLHIVCEALRKGEADPEGLFALAFWIGLYGAMSEMRAKFYRTFETAEVLRQSGKHHPFITASAAVFEACDAIRSSLTDDEIVFVTFMRQIHAHVYQDGFEQAVERGNPEENQPGSIRDKQMIPLLRRHVAVEEAHQILEQISSKNGHDEFRVATNFAHKVGPFVEKLEAAMSALEVEREKDAKATAQLREVRTKNAAIEPLKLSVGRGRPPAA